MRRFASLLLATLLLPVSAQDETGWRTSTSQSLQELRSTVGKWPRVAGSTPIGLENASLFARSSEAASLSLTPPVAAGIAVEPVSISGGNFADQITPEIKALARGLQYDPLTIFNFVRNRVDYDCYYGSKKGAHLTLMEMSGNDYDQSSLLVALLRASGYPATYVAAPVTFTYDLLSSATGVESPYSNLSDSEFAAEVSTVERPILASDPDLSNLRKEFGISAFLLNRGFPIVQRSTQPGPSLIVSHVWVRFTVNGQTVNVSPSLKGYSQNPAIDVAPAEMTKSAIINAASGDVDATGKKWVEKVDYAALSDLLSGYTKKVLKNLKDGYDKLAFDEVISTRKIVPVVYTDLSSAPQIEGTTTGWSSFETWSDAAVPDEKISKVLLSASCYTQNGVLAVVNGIPIYKRTFTMAELAGRKLSLGFSGDGFRTATFYLDDVAEGLPYTSYFAFPTPLYVKIEVKHPHYSFALDGQGIYQKSALGRHDSASIQGYHNGSVAGNTVPFCYSIVSAFENPRKLLKKREAILEKMRKDGAQDTDLKVRTEILNILGLSWYDQTWRHSRFPASHLQVLPMYHHRIGRVGQQFNYFIDVTEQRYAVDHRGLDPAIGHAYLGIEALMDSAMEHAVVDQAVGRPVATSTVKMIWKANQASERIYRMQSDTWDTEKGSLTGYSTSDLGYLDAVFDLPNHFGLIPKKGNLVMNSWTGAGYSVVSPTGGHAMRISGGLNGGFGTVSGYIGSNPLLVHLQNDPSYNSSFANLLAYSATPHTTPQQVSWDPVDMRSGAFLLDKADLSLGRLEFSRHYNSNLRNNGSSGVGDGWTHGHDIRVVERSSTLPALGETNAYQAAALYVSSLAASMVYDNGSAEDWTVAALISHWGAEMTFRNAVAITFANKTIEFVKMPDGTFVPPPGMNYTLTKTGGTPPTATADAVLGTYSLTERNGNTYLFNTKGRIATITDPNGNTQQFNYSSDQLSTVVDSFGHTFTYSWAGGKITSVSDGTGRTVGLNYADGKNLTSVTDVESKTWTYQYDNGPSTPVGPLISQKDPKSRTMIVNDYDFANRVIRQRSMGLSAEEWHYAWSGFLNLEQNPQGGLTGYHYDNKGRSIGVSDALGNTTTSEYDGQDRMTLSVDAKGDSALRDWNSDNNLVTETDPQNHVVSFFYDGLMRLKRMNDKAGKDSLYTWTAQHQLETFTDPLLHTTTNTYYGNGKLKTVKDGENKVTTFEYNKGYLEKIIDPDLKVRSLGTNNRGESATPKDGEGRVTTNTYNKRGQPLTSTLPAVPGEPTAQSVWSYDDCGNLEAFTDARGKVTSYTYNALANPITTTLPALAAGTNVLTNSYDTRDWLEKVTNSVGHETIHTYDAAKRLIGLHDPLGRFTETLFDANGRVTDVIDPLSRVTKQAWNSRGESDYSTDGLGKITDLSYDPNGNLRARKNRRHKTFLTRFDDANRPYESETPSGKVTATTYYNNNIVRTVKEPSLQLTTLGYNGRNLLESKSDPTGTITHTYDDSGLLKTTTEGGVTITRAYDERGRLKSLTTADGDLIQYRYDSNGNLRLLIYPDGKEVAYTYNARNQLETVKDWRSAPNNTTTYVYDRLGRLVGTTRPNGTSNLITYDAGGQVTSIKENAGAKAISYLRFNHDLAGQITRRFRAPVPYASWEHPSFVGEFDDDNRLLNAGGFSVVHDDDGNMTTGPIRANSGYKTLVYNSRNQLTATDGVNYTYDAEGNRRTMANGTTSTRFVIDSASALSRLLVKHVTVGSTTSKTYYVYGLGLLYEVNEAGSTKTHHYDQAGSTIIRTNDAGDVIGKAEYSSYGLTISKEGDFETPFLYNGRQGVYSDPNGLLYMRARYYSPFLMRFLNPDPIGFSGGSNWFAYANGNPISLSDPFGLCAQGESRGLWNDIKDIFTGLGNSMGAAMYNPQGALISGVDKTIDGALSPVGYGQVDFEPFKALGAYEPGSNADKGGAFMSLYLNAAGGYLVGRMGGETPISIKGLSIGGESGMPKFWTNLIPEYRPPGILLKEPLSIVKSGYSGSVDYVVTIGGGLRMGESHAYLSGGGAVMSAGRATFRDGALMRLDNWSGHYRPFGVDPAIPENAFNANGFQATGLYRETLKPR